MWFTVLKSLDDDVSDKPAKLPIPNIFQNDIYFNIWVT